MRILCFILVLLVMGCVDQKKYDLNAWAGGVERDGKMRQDRDPADAPVDAELLSRNFEKIAYTFEVDPLQTGVVQTDENRIKMLRRWETDIRLSVLENPALRLGTTRRDIFAFMRKLAGLTGVPYGIRNRWKKNSGPANFLVLAGDDNFFDSAIPALRGAAARWDGKKGDAGAAFADFLGEWHRSYSPCAGYIYVELADPEDDDTETGRILGALVTIRTDLAAPFTQVCIEEELSQVMGLVNDDPDVRPSIFNDDQEFALLTRHDELLLQILYNERLRAGMTPEQSMPIVRQIAADLLPYR